MFFLSLLTSPEPPDQFQQNLAHTGFYFITGSRRGFKVHHKNKLKTTKKYSSDEEHGGIFCAIIAQRSTLTSFFS